MTSAVTDVDLCALRTNPSKPHKAQNDTDAAACHLKTSELPDASRVVFTSVKLTF